MKMKKEDITVLAHALSAIKDAVIKLEEAQKKKDNEKILDAKKEILVLQGQIGELL